jgi:alkylation response protein AidB-like acyl-CoA dehydrogenase
MDLSFTPQEQAFRDDVQRFLTQEVPERLKTKGRDGQRFTKADYEAWHALLNKKGWLATAWPVQYGGTGWSVVQRFIFDNECALAHTPRIQPFGVNMVAPVIIKYGTQAQKQHWLPRILNGEDWWCQGYSEPSAGSDLASVKTTAVREGEHYILNGQKTWTTLAQYANMIFCLVRTDREAKAQAGISFVLVDMRTPGIELRPIRMLDGEHEVNEVFFTNVRVPVANLVGEENKGWDCAKFLLTHERTTIAGVGYSVAGLERLKNLAARVMKNGKPLDQDALFAARLAKVEIDLDNMKTTNLRVIAAVAGGGVPGAESSMLKIKGTEIRQEILSLTRRALGPLAQPYVKEALDEGYADAPLGPKESAFAAAHYFNYRKLSIYGGSNEIQKNIISKMILGL